MKTPAERLAEIEQAGGFVSSTDLPSLIEADRLRLVLIRFTSGLRLTAAVQYVAEIVEKLESTGEYVRDVQFSPFNAMTIQPDPATVHPSGFPRHTLRNSAGSFETSNPST